MYIGILFGFSSGIYVLASIPFGKLSDIFVSLFSPSLELCIYLQCTLAVLSRVDIPNLIAIVLGTANVWNRWASGREFLTHTDGNGSVYSNTVSDQLYSCRAFLFILTFVFFFYFSTMAGSIQWTVVIALVIYSIAFAMIDSPVYSDLLEHAE